MQKRWMILLAALGLLSFTGSFLSAGIFDDAYESFQQDADIVKLKHLQYYGELLEKYKEKTGKYPFQGLRKFPIYTFIANGEQVDDVRGGPSYEHAVAGVDFFFKTLSDGLGYKVKEYYDPQYAPDNKPNFYIYMVNGNSYFFAVHLHQAYPFATQVRPGYNKLEISNNPTEQNKAKSPKTLFQQKEFLNAKGKLLAKPDFFEAREKKYLFSSKNLPKQK